MSQGVEKRRNRGDRIARLRKRLAAVAEADAKEHITDPMVSIVRGILDLLEDEL